MTHGYRQAGQLCLEKYTTSGKSLPTLSQPFEGFNENRENSYHCGWYMISFSAVLGMEPKALHMLCKYPTTELSLS